MFKGLLTVDGTIDTQQFWPNGRSDADTVKVAVKADSFTFTPDPKTTPARQTNVFAGAQVMSRGQPTPAIKNGTSTSKADSGVESKSAAPRMAPAIVGGRIVLMLPRWIESSLR